MLNLFRMMQFAQKTCRHTLLQAVFLCLAASAVHGAVPPGTVAKFLAHHCTECHDNDVSKGDLNIAGLDYNPADPAVFKTWQRIFERVRDGEMPPDKKPRPSSAELATFLPALKQPLLAADAADIAVRGRVLGRRLTRTEYENTLHDLLGIDIPLKVLLPEDPASHGFETVAQGQQLSHHQLARYLDAADTALTDAFDRAMKGDAPYERFHSPEELSRRTGGNYRGPDLRDGWSISWPITLQFFGRMPTTTVRADGWYRITLKDVQAVNPGPGGSVWGTLRSGACSSAAPMLYMVGLVEATSTPRDLVYEAWIQGGHMLELKPNDATLNRAPTGASGGNVSFAGRDLEKQGFAGIRHHGIKVERIHPNADAGRVRHNLIGSKPAESWKANPAGAVEELVPRFAERAFRRPVTPEVAAPYVDIGQMALKEGKTLPGALKAAYRAILCSPRFLTFVETPGRLDDHAVASRLSYALWVSMPDQVLSQLATEGKLSHPGTLSAQIDRMLADPRSDRFVQSFTDQWLNLNQIDFTSPDTRQFRTFDPALQESMLQETRAYFARLIRDNLSVTHLVDSDFTFLNERLVRHYGIKSDVQPGHGLQQVGLRKDGTNVRGGLLTQGAVLKVTADGTSTSPVVRGVFVNERILGVHIPPPPPGVPAIEPDIRGATSIRDQLDKHRSNESCAACHRTIDPPGFALENFDPVGGWRTRYGLGKGVPVNPSGSTPQGDSFANLSEWKRIYSQRGEQLARAFAGQFLTYGTGAPMRFSDESELASIASKASADNHGMRSLLHASIASRIFLHK